MTRRILFASSAVVGLALASAALAQTAPDCNANPSAPGCQQAPSKNTTVRASSVDELVVTGSRIKTSNFSSTAPLTVVTPEQAQLRGATDIAGLLQSLPAANNAVQINNFFTGFVTTGGPGINTLSLRGLGAQRTLFLIDGQRLGPAGVGGTVGPVDLNTLNFPQAEISDVEILKDGASSIYGSDAIGGVVNIITKKNYDGADLRVFYGPSQDGGANTYQVDASFGKTFSKGYINAGFSFYQQTALRLGERPYLDCARDLSTLAGGGSGDVAGPNGQPVCQNLFAPAMVDFPAPAFAQVDYAASPGTIAGTGPTGQNVAGWQAVGLILCNNPTIIYSQNGNSCGPAGVNVTASRASLAQIPFTPPGALNTTAISPDTRYMFNLYGGYDLSPHVHLYGSLILTERLSSQFNEGQIFPSVNPGNTFNPGFTFPLPIVPYGVAASQKVDYGRATLGVKGDFPDFSIFHDWSFDLYGEFSQSHGYYTQDYALTDRVNATAGSATPSGCDVNAISESGATMAQQEPGVACVPVNWFAAVQNGAFTPTEQSFLFKNETGWTIYNHYYVEGSASGNLFNLPGGPVGASAGFQLRREEIDDNPATDVQDANVWGYLTAGRTHGSDTIKEVYGELRLPFLKDLPMIKSLTFDASGRYSDYKSYGSTGTYKISLDWAFTDWLALRANQGTGFRAPALYELFLADQTSFLSQVGLDPCINYGTSNISANVQKNCAAQGIPSNYGGNGGSAEIFTGGGIGNLKAETSLFRNVGLVFTPQWYGINLKVAADYYSFDIRNQIQNFGAANILYQCYNAPNFPNNPFCNLFSRDLTPGTPNYLNITSVQDNYVNVARELDQGLDVDITWIQKLPYNVKFTLDSQLSWTFYTNTVLLNGSINNYLGQVGQPMFVGYVDFKFDRGPWTFFWHLNMVGHTSDNPFVANTNTNYLGLGQTVTFDHQGPFYTTSSVSIRRKFDKWTLAIGSQNVFNASPPLYGAEGFQSRIGNVPLISQYDLIGRTFFFDAERKF